MKVGICGLGLIGGSMAKAYKRDGHTVYGHDKNKLTEEYAKMNEIIDGTLDESVIGACEVILIALYPEAAINYMKEIAPLVDKNTLVMDLCGTKRTVCESGFALAEQYGFTYVGAHPMAGTQYSGIKYADVSLFDGAPVVIVPPRYDDIELFSRIKTSLAPARFGKISITKADDHDKIIAYTSQLAHVVSNAYVKSPTAKLHKGYSAGSYSDLTRVAWLNEDMWAGLFIENRDNLINEIDTIISSLTEYKDAIQDKDVDRLRTLLREGRIAKEQVDGTK